MKASRFVSGLLISAALSVFVCNNSIAGVQKKIFNGKATIEIPEGFEKVSNNAVGKKTGKKITENTEIWVLPKEEGKVMLLLQLSGNKVSEDQLPQVAEAIKKGGKAKVSSVSDINVNGQKMSRVTMVSDSPRGKLISLIQLSSMNGLLLKANFLVTEDLKDQYSTMADQTLSTLKY